jgi:hypothetical protein
MRGSDGLNDADGLADTREREGLELECFLIVTRRVFSSWLFKTSLFWIAAPV